MNVNNMATITLELILELYQKYADDLLKTRKRLKGLYHHLGYKNYQKTFIYRVFRAFRILSGLKVKEPLLKPQLDDLEAEITYLLLREFKPEVVVEISPGGGWSTCWILSALNDNENGELLSYDLIDDSTHCVKPELSRGRWHFIRGDVREQLLPGKIDYLFIDSEHSETFAWWYIKNVFPKVRIGGIISVHDVFHTDDPGSFSKEGKVIIKYLETQGIPYFTASPAKNKHGYLSINRLRRRLGFGSNIHFHRYNSMIFFIWPALKNSTGSCKEDQHSSLDIVDT
jgi:predicted O-methyltransferase YrrM